MPNPVSIAIILSISEEKRSSAEQRDKAPEYQKCKEVQWPNPPPPCENKHEFVWKLAIVESHAVKQLIATKEGRKPEERVND